MFEHLRDRQHAVYEAHQMLADYMEDYEAGLIYIRGPGICKVIYCEPGNDEPIESGFDESVSVVYWG